MNKYSVKIEAIAEVEAFDENDAMDYINDIFGTDEEVVSVKIVAVKKSK